MPADSAWCTEAGGNLLLNVGPTGRGRFDPEAVRILRAVGEWMALHEPSVRGCVVELFLRD